MTTGHTFKSLNISVAVNASMLPKGYSNLMVSFTVTALGTDLIHFNGFIFALDYINGLRFGFILASKLHDSWINLVATLLTLVASRRVLHERPTFVAELHCLTPRIVLIY